MRYLKALKRTPFFKITSLNGISVLIKIGIGLITSKILAIFIGPSGMGLVGNFRNFFSSIENVATLGFQTGVTKYVVDNKENEVEFRKIVATVFISLLLISIIIGGLLFYFSDALNSYIFGANFHYSFVFKALALCLPWYSISLFLISVINGLGKFKKVIYINIIGNIIGLIIASILIFEWRTFGALCSIVIAPSSLFFVSCYYVNKEFSLVNTISFQFFNIQIIKKLLPYSLMTIVSGIVGPLVLLSIRNNVIDIVGLEQAGYWETISRISTYYLMFISTILTIYFFPKLAFAKNNKDSKKVFWSYYKGVMPFFIIVLTVIYILRNFIIQLLFTKAFLPVSELFFWQLVGDIFKASALILGHQFFAKKLTIAFISTEVFSLGVMYFFSTYFVSIFGIQGVVIAHALTYFIYLLVLSIYFRKILF